MVIPAFAKQVIDDYVKYGHEPGSFFRAVLENNLMEAMGQADEGNRGALFDICCYVYDKIPAACHGNQDVVVSWIEAGGRVGLERDL